MSSYLSLKLQILNSKQEIGKTGINNWNTGITLKTIEWMWINFPPAVI